jgi:hypothetical protein
VQNTKYWILGFTVLHIIGANQFFRNIGALNCTLVAGIGLLLVVNMLVLGGKDIGGLDQGAASFPPNDAGIHDFADSQLFHVKVGTGT